MFNTERPGGSGNVSYDMDPVVSHPEVTVQSSPPRPGLTTKLPRKLPSLKSQLSVIQGSPEVNRNISEVKANRRYQL